MCTNNVGVVKRIEVEQISKEISDLVKELDKEISHGRDHVDLPVQKVKHVTTRLNKILE
jgi:hypothetical protein